MLFSDVVCTHAAFHVTLISFGSSFECCPLMHEPLASACPQYPANGPWRKRAADSSCHLLSMVALVAMNAQEHLQAAFSSPFLAQFHVVRVLHLAPLGGLSPAQARPPAICWVCKTVSMLARAGIMIIHAHNGG